MSLFGTAGIRGPVSEITPELALAVGRAMGRDVRSSPESSTAGGWDADRATEQTAQTPSSKPTVVLARDGRVTGEPLATAVAAGLMSAGVRVLDAGRLPTPALAFASRNRHGVMVTASHNPPTDNGIKLFADGQEYHREDEQRIEASVDRQEPLPAWRDWGDTQRRSPLPGYRRAVVDFARKHGSDVDVTLAVDCGNGMAGLATPQVLADLGASVSALNANVDGHFSARESKPTPESLGTLRHFVADGDAELGIAHDGDGDRIVVVDADGEVVHEDTVLAILAEHYTSVSEADDPVVVTTPNASKRIDDRVRAAGGRTERVALGALHEGIVRAHTSGTPNTTVAFAAEPWKHIHPGFGGWIDAVVSAAVFTGLVAEQGLESLRAPIDELPYRKVSVPCPNARKSAAMGDLNDRLPDVFPEATVETAHGIRLELPDGSWTLVRPSGTEAFVRIYAEGTTVDDLVSEVRETVETAIDSSGGN